MTGQISIEPFNKIRKGYVICVNNRPCKILSISTSKPGKHGSAKANMDTVDIFTNKKIVYSCGTTDNIHVPIVKKVDYQIMGIDMDDGYLFLLNYHGDPKNDVRIANKKYLEELSEKYGLAQIQDKYLMVTVMSCMDNEKVVSCQID